MLTVTQKIIFTCLGLILISGCNSTSSSVAEPVSPAPETIATQPLTPSPIEITIALGLKPCPGKSDLLVVISN